MAENAKKLQGEIYFDTSEATKAMSNLSKATKETTAKLKLNDAEMKRDGETTENLKAKAKLLREQIAKQKDTIAKVTEEYNKAVKVKGKDSKEAQALNLKLIALKTTLANQEKQLQETDKKADDLADSFDDVKDAAKEVKEEGEGIGAKLKSGLDAAKTIVDGIAESIKALCDTTWQITLNAATSYDDAATAAAMLGVSYDEYMKTAYAAQTSDINPDDYYKAFSKFETLFNTGSQEDIDSLREVLGLTEEAFAEYQQMLNGGDWLGAFESILANGEGLTNEQLKKMFGEESVKKLQTVLGDNWEAFANRRENALEVGFVMTLDEQQSLLAFSDSYQTFKQNWDAMLQNLGATFAVDITPIVDDAASMVGAVSAAIQAGFSEGNLDTDAIAAAISEWLPDILIKGAGILRVAKTWVDLLNGIMKGGLDGLFGEDGVFGDDEEMQKAAEEWGEALSDLWGDGENGLSGLFITIRDKVLVPLWNWIKEKVGELAALIWDGIVQLLPDEVRGHLGIQTTEEKEITADYNENAAEVIPEVIEEMIQPDKRQMSAIERAEYLEGNQINVGGISVSVKAETGASADEIGEEVAKKIQQALNDLNLKSGLRTVGGGGRRVRVSD